MQLGRVSTTHCHDVPVLESNVMKCQEPIEATSHPRRMLEVFACCFCCKKQHACTSIIPRAKYADVSKPRKRRALSIQSNDWPALQRFAFGTVPSVFGREFKALTGKEVDIQRHAVGLW
jgi:hypothetical protein